MNSITMENAEKFIAAVNAMPTRDFLKTMVVEAGAWTEGRAARQPADMGATPGTSGLHSTGNVPTKGRGYYQRGFGSRYVSKITGATSSSKRRSEELQLKWRRERSGDGMTVEVLNSVKYGGRVQGGKNDPQRQTRVMDARGWETVDEVAKAAEANFEVIINRTIQSHYDQWFAKYGV